MDRYFLLKRNLRERRRIEWNENLVKLQTFVFVNISIFIFEYEWILKKVDKTKLFLENLLYIKQVLQIS